ncbi:MAG: hypothetical protein WA830_10005 [Candidatus Sulfotelmatobacter sp.]
MIALAGRTANRILFLLGLWALIDAMKEMPLVEVLDKIPLDHATKAALLGQPSRLRPAYQLMLAHESGEWKAAAELSSSLHLDSEDVAELYWQAQQWHGKSQTGGKTAYRVRRKGCLELEESFQSCPPVQKEGGLGPCAVTPGRVP